MKKISSVAVMLTLVCSLLSAQQGQAPQQQKVVHFKKLQTFLPAQDFQGFKRGKPVGNTSTAMGFSSSEASVRFVKGSDSAEQSIEIKILDMSLVPYGSWAMMYQQTDYENETENGYEKTVMVKKTYKGIEKAETGDYKSCSLNFAAGNRFHIELTGSGFADGKLLTTLAESMDLDKLAKVTAE